MELYFRDNFFNSGSTEILNANQDKIGEVDLRSSFGSSLEVFNVAGGSLYSGEFPFFSGKWTVTGADGAERGRLRGRMSFFSKKFEYEAYGRGVFDIEAGAFSSEYEIRDAQGQLAAAFEKVSGWFSSSAYRLSCETNAVDAFEWVAVILGLNEIQKRQRS
ncbi:hypothetical protein [Paenibacillus methanolicus]|uniref:Uncharacterized protein n=1 Tax=Paenibacillus methanolicus TaxID=582686 RepID=A0A5S5BZK8_9BACL|nr:hypothetical protein [Paenibacillus methanolicus]TYP72477.1 hypothetical protein BCM02_108131 [Paenibacillus methanolicus]